MNVMQLRDDDKVLPVMMVGNKSELEHVNSQRQVYETWCEDNNVLGYCDVSALTNSNIDTVITTLVDYILRQDDDVTIYV